MGQGTRHVQGSRKRGGASSFSKAAPRLCASCPSSQNRTALRSDPQASRSGAELGRRKKSTAKGQAIKASEECTTEATVVEPEGGEERAAVVPMLPAGGATAAATATTTTTTALEEAVVGETATAAEQKENRTEKISQSQALGSGEGEDKPGGLPQEQAPATGRRRPH